MDSVVAVVNYLAEQIEEYLRGQNACPSGPWCARSIRAAPATPCGCRDHLLVGYVPTLNGDDLYGAADLAESARHPAGVLVHPVDALCQFGVAFLKPDGTLEKLVEKPDLDGRRPANTGAYVFPVVFDHELTVLPRGEYEITQYVTALAQSGTVHVVEATFWLPIGTVEVWQEAQGRDLDAVMKGR